MAYVRIWTLETFGSHVALIVVWLGPLGLLKIRHFAKRSIFLSSLKNQMWRNWPYFPRWSQTQLPPSDHTYIIQFASFHQFPLYDTQTPPQVCTHRTLVYLPLEEAGGMWVPLSTLRLSPWRGFRKWAFPRKRGQQTQMTHKTSFKYYRDLK